MPKMLDVYLRYGAQELDARFRVRLDVSAQNAPYDFVQFFSEKRKVKENANVKSIQ